MPVLTTAPLWIAVVLLVGVLPLLAMCGPVVVRRFVSLERLRANNEVAGFKFATVGVLYAVLLAFAVVVVWEKFSQAENDRSRDVAQPGERQRRQLLVVHAEAHDHPRRAPQQRDE